MTITVDVIAAGIAAVCPKSDANGWANCLFSPLMEAEINTANRLSCFLGQVAAESDFIIQHENMEYTEADRIYQIFRSHFTSPGEAQAYVRNPQALASRVYANRLGNGDEQSCDGWIFRGAGLIQLTGREQFVKFGNSVGLSAEDAMAFCLTREGAAKSAIWFWNQNSLNILADGWRVTQITMRVNGSRIDAPRRVRLCAQVIDAIGE